MTPAPASALLATEGRDPGRLIVHGEVPSIESLGLNPFARAAMSTTAWTNAPAGRPRPPGPAPPPNPCPRVRGCRGPMPPRNPGGGPTAAPPPVTRPPGSGGPAAP